MRRLVLVFLSLTLVFVSLAQINPDKWVEVNGHKKYSNLKQALEHPEKVHSLTVYYPKVKQFPTDLLRFTKVDSLVLYLCSVAKLPDELSWFKKTRHLEIWHPASPDLPKELGQLSALESLTIVRKGELSFHKEWTNLKKLKKLRFVHCTVLFPDEMYKLQALEEIFLIQTKLHILPPWLIGLKNLKGLLVVNDKALEVPQKLREKEDLRIKIVAPESKN